MRWDLVNIRVILRAKHAGRHNDEILANLIPAGRLNEPALKEVAGPSDVTGVAGALGGLHYPLALPLAGGLAANRGSVDKLSLELHLERFYAAYGMRIA